MTCQDSSHPLRRRGHKSRLLQINSSYGLVIIYYTIVITVSIVLIIIKFNCLKCQLLPETPRERFVRPFSLSCSTGGCSKREKSEMSSLCYRCSALERSPPSSFSNASMPVFGQPSLSFIPRSCTLTLLGGSSRSPRASRRPRRTVPIALNVPYFRYIFTIVSYLIGVFIFATIVGQVGNVITNRNANRLEFERLLDGAKTYMRHHKVPGGMKRRVLRWYDYSWSRYASS